MVMHFYMNYSQLRSCENIFCIIYRYKWLESRKSLLGKSVLVVIKKMVFDQIVSATIVLSLFYIGKYSSDGI